MNFNQPNPLLIWTLKNPVWKIQLDELDFLSILNLNFAGYTGSKIQVHPTGFFKLNIFLQLLCLSRDNGIVISISIVQWLYEWVNICFFHIYIHSFSGTSLLIDHFFDLYNITALMVIEPCFYLRADETFRRNWANLGPLQAIKLAFL